MPKGAKYGGRKAGTPNKVTGEVKDLILQALAESGGVEYLKRQANESPTAFLSLIGRVLPLQVAAKVEGAVAHTVEIAIIDPKGTP